MKIDHKKLSLAIMDVAQNRVESFQENQPFIMHPLRIMANFRDNEYFLKTCAMLHNEFEDRIMSKEVLIERWGEEVFEVLDLVSRQENERYLDFINRIVNSGNLNAILVKFFDIDDNFKRSKFNKNPKFKRLFKDRYEPALEILGNKLLELGELIEPEVPFGSLRKKSFIEKWEKNLVKRKENEMVRIIRQKCPELEKKVIHKDCGCEIGYFENETKESKYTDYAGDTEIYKYINCPNCKEKVVVK